MAKKPVTLKMPPATLEYWKDVAWWCRTTLTTIIEQGAEQELMRLQFANGGDFQPIDESVVKQPPRTRGEAVKMKQGIRLDVGLIEQLARAAWWLDTSAVAIIAKGAENRVKQLEAKHNKGNKFPKREEEQ